MRRARELRGLARHRDHALRFPPWSSRAFSKFPQWIQDEFACVGTCGESEVCAQSGGELRHREPWEVAWAEETSAGSWKESGEDSGFPHP